MSQKRPLKLNTHANWKKNQRTFSSNVEKELTLMVAEDDPTLFDNSKLISKIVSSKRRKLAARNYKRKYGKEFVKIPRE